jgi:hypothetical protein
MDGGGVEAGELLEVGKFDMYGDGVRNGFVSLGTDRSSPNGIICGTGGGIPAMMNAS